MSKRNKNKSKQAASAVDSVAPVQHAISDAASGKSDDLRQEFKHLIITITLIIVLLFIIYYFDQKDQILDKLADKLFQLFR